MVAEPKRAVVWFKPSLCLLLLWRQNSKAMTKESYSITVAIIMRVIIRTASCQQAQLRLPKPSLGNHVAI